MTLGDPEPQPERLRELIVTGTLKQFKGVMDIEAGLWRDRTFRHLRRDGLVLLGPIVHGDSLIWIVPSSQEPALFPDPDGAEPITISLGDQILSLPPGMSLQQIHDRAVRERFDLYRALRLGLLRAGPLPAGRLRLLFAVARFINPPVFWLWVDSLTAELARLGFRPTPSPGEPPPSGESASPPSAQPSAQPEPWLQIPDRRSDRRILELWWQGLTMPQIADRVGYSKKTVRNRLWKLRAEHGSAIVPTGRQLRRLGTK